MSTKTRSHPDAVQQGVDGAALAHPPAARGRLLDRGGLLAGGGVFVNGDHLHEPVGLERLNQAGTDRALPRRGSAPARGEDWSAWWAAAGRAPELADLLGQPGPRPIEHTVPDVPTVADHQQLLRTAGFGQVGTVWQQGDDRILVALR
jgi:hypothetical protein